MSDGTTMHESSGGRLIRGVRRGFLMVLGFFLCILLLPMLVGRGWYEVGLALLAGWIGFLQRTLPRITANYDLLAMTALCVVLICGLGHVLAAWLTRAIAAARGVQWRWPWKWTWCGLSGMAVLFLVGMAIAGMCHQLGWIAASSEPLLEVKGPSRTALVTVNQLHFAFEVALVNADGDLAKARAALWKKPDDYFTPRKGMTGLATLQSVCFLVVVDGRGALQGYFIFPRDAARMRGRVALHVHGDASEWLAPKELNELLQANREQLEPL